MFDNWYVVQVRTGKEEAIAKKLQFHIDHDVLFLVAKDKRNLEGNGN